VERTPVRATFTVVADCTTVTVEEDRASDRRIAIAFAAVLVLEVVLAFMADAGTYPLWVWLVLAVGAVLVAGLVFRRVQRRAEGATPRRP
jgi:hypothetical protein